jgi:hypothetical protein
MLVEPVSPAGFRLFLEVLMYNPLRLICILVHPDDEFPGTGSTLARYCTEGIETLFYGRSLEYDLFEGLRSPAQVYFKKFTAVENCL